MFYDTVLLYAQFYKLCVLNIFYEPTRFLRIIGVRNGPKDIKWNKFLLFEQMARLGPIKSSLLHLKKIGIQIGHTRISFYDSRV